MSRNKIIGWIFIVLAIVVVAALFVNNRDLWIGIDVLTITVCLISGVMLIRGGK